MASPDPDQFRTITTIIGRDCRDTRYRYALLRGAVEIVQEYPHLGGRGGSRVIYSITAGLQQFYSTCCKSKRQARCARFLQR